MSKLVFLGGRRRGAAGEPQAASAGHPGCAVRRGQASACGHAGSGPPRCSTSDGQCVATPRNTQSRGFPSGLEVGVWWTGEGALLAPGYPLPGAGPHCVSAPIRWSFSFTRCSSLATFICRTCKNTHPRDACPHSCGTQLQPQAECPASPHARPHCQRSDQRPSSRPLWAETWVPEMSLRPQVIEDRPGEGGASWPVPFAALPSSSARPGRSSEQACRGDSLTCRGHS